jgi:nucleotide-binding universal stress UspA family protein
MSLPKMILVPTDFGEPSDCAIKYAVELAKAMGSQIVLMHAYELPIIGFPDGAIVATAELTSRILEGAQVGLDRQIKSHEGAGIPIRGLIKQGDPWAMVNETVEDIAADLVVMGTHGRTGIPRMLIGSVAEKVVRTAKVPVLTVHPHDITLTPKAEFAQPQPPVSNGVVTDRSKPAPSHR